MSGAVRGLAGKRRLVAAMLWAERLETPLAAPILLLLAFVIIAAVGLLALLPWWAGAAAPILILLTAVGAAGWGLHPIAAPTAAEIDRRLEHGDPHRPLSTLVDRPALSCSRAVWDDHLARARARAEWLRPPPPRLGGGALAIAAGVALGLVSVLAAPHAGGNLRRAFAPSFTAAAAPALLQAWIVPPPATGLPPVFLRAGDPRPGPVPVGSTLTASVLGGGSRPVLLYAGRRSRFQRLGQASFQTTVIVAVSSTLAVTRAGHRLGAWRLAVAADRPPTIRITGPAGLADRQLTLPWRADDDNGLATVTAELRLRDRPGAPALQIPLPLAGFPRVAASARLPDLTANPWAGLSVIIRYVAHDSLGRRGVSGDAGAVLPERVFLNPAAQAVLRVRRDLALDPTRTAAALAGLDAVSRTSIGHITLGEWLDLRAIAAQLAQHPGAQDQIAGRLWQLATSLEDAGVADARQRLNQASEALRDALATPPEAPRDIEALTQALQQAMQAYLQAMQRQADRAGQGPPEQVNGRTIDQAQLEQMARDLAEAARAGRTDDAARRLQQLSQMLQNLRAGGSSGSGQAGRQDPALQNLLQDQAALQNHADRRLSGAQPGTAADRGQDAKAQQALRQRLADLAARLGEQAGAIPQGLATADQAMREAREALGGNDDRGARGAQQRALDGLRSGQGQLANRQNNGAPNRDGNADPLGRLPSDGNGAAPNPEDTTLPQQEVARGRALRDELRRRDADRTRAPAELNYIERLLNY